jgi:pantoate--beta-alanine ligase
MTNTAPMVISTIGELRAKLDAAGAGPGRRIGFVPTMGYLHEGHAALVRRARAECDVVVVSIFVNPTQFGPGEDFATYPRDLERDMSILRAERADVVFTPDAKEMYPPGADTSVMPGAVAEPLEGKRRPGHFRGVATVVTMLFNAVRPTHAYFGEKDWQQLQVVRHLVSDLHMPLSIVAVPTMREPDGLAMSSRNVRLSASERAAAVCVPRSILAAQRLYRAGERSPAILERAMVGVIAGEPLATLDYATVVDGRTLRPTGHADEASRALIAVRIGSVRLIDNASLSHTP